MASSVVIVDYAMGNLFSVKKKFSHLHITPLVSANATEINNADKIILPGVGHFAKAMENLRSMNLLEALNEHAIIKKKPILGICLGMQLMANHSEEGDAEGLKWIDAEVVKFQVFDRLRWKIPHMGWNNVSIVKESLLFKDIPDQSEFYFVHSYHLNCKDKTDILNLTNYSYDFVSAIEKNNIFGVQYHPEKSHDAGAQLLRNFIDL